MIALLISWLTPAAVLLTSQKRNRIHLQSWVLQLFFYTSKVLHLKNIFLDADVK